MSPDKKAQTIELLAPAGSFESIQAAIQAGADSVYFGMGHLNMRARSAINFTPDDLPEIRKRLDQAGMKAYLTVNVTFYDHDLKTMRYMIDHAKKAGLDAVIASDVAAIQYAHEIGMPVHLSTQANISNIEAVAWYSRYADVMVLARELNLKQVRQITDAIRNRNITGPSGQPVRIEIFAHGALCMAVSGKCYLSLHTHNASANRGACVQNCRRQYVVTDKEEGFEFEVDNEYIMSASDLCTIDLMEEMIASGASIFKIEGRGRSADYVFTTVKAYREAIDKALEGTTTPDDIARWQQMLSSVYNRGFWEGYYMGRKLAEWADTGGSKATETKIYIGKGVKYFSRIGVGEFLVETGKLCKNDKILITGPTTGVLYEQVRELRIDNQPVDEAGKGALVSLPVPTKIRPSDKLYKIVPAK